MSPSAKMGIYGVNVSNEFVRLNYLWRTVPTSFKCNYFVYLAVPDTALCTYIILFVYMGSFVQNVHLQSRAYFVGGPSKK